MPRRVPDEPFQPDRSGFRPVGEYAEPLVAAGLGMGVLGLGLTFVEADTDALVRMLAEMPDSPVIEDVRRPHVTVDQDSFWMGCGCSLASRDTWGIGIEEVTGTGRAMLRSRLDDNAPALRDCGLSGAESTGVWLSWDPYLEVQSTNETVGFCVGQVVEDWLIPIGTRAVFSLTPPGAVDSERAPRVDVYEPGYRPKLPGIFGTLTQEEWDSALIGALDAEGLEQR